MKRKDAEQRWNEDVSNRISNCLAKGREISEEIESTEDGRSDFRGIHLTEVVEGKALEKMDFSFASFVLAGMLIDCCVNDCVFDRVDAQTNLGNQFSNCSFRNAKLAGARFNGSFSVCDFTSANLRGRMAVEVKFVDCIFDKASFLGTHFIRCTFENCSWKGAKFGGGSIEKSIFVNSFPDKDLMNDHMHEGIEIRTDGDSKE